MHQTIDVTELALIISLPFAIVAFMLGWIIRKLDGLRATLDVMRAVLAAIHLNGAYARHNSGRLMVHYLGLRELDTVPEFLHPQDQSVERIGDTPR